MSLWEPLLVTSSQSRASYRPWNNGNKAKAALLQMGVIFKPEDAPEGLFYNGQKSTEPFQIEPGNIDPGDDGYGFEMAGIFSSSHFILVPDEYVDGVSCPKCNADPEPAVQFSPRSSLCGGWPRPLMLSVS